MWTSHDTVGFVFLAGFCVQFGFSFEGKNCIFFSYSLSQTVSSCRARCPAWWKLLGRRKKVLKVRSLCTKAKGGCLEGIIIREMHWYKAQKGMSRWKMRMFFLLPRDVEKMQLVIVPNQVISHRMEETKSCFFPCISFYTIKIYRKTKHILHKKWADGFSTTDSCCMRLSMVLKACLPCTLGSPLLNCSFLLIAAFKNLL